MLRDELIFEDCLVELPPFGKFPMRSLKKVIEPVRPWQEPDAVIHWDTDVRRATIGYVYTIPNAQKELKQVYVEIDEGGTLFCNDAYFLENPHPDLKPVKFPNSQVYSKVRDSGQGPTLTRDEQETLVRLSGWTVAHTSLAARCG